MYGSAHICALVLQCKLASLQPAANPRTSVHRRRRRLWILSLRCSAFLADRQVVSLPVRCRQWQRTKARSPRSVSATCPVSIPLHSSISNQYAIASLQRSIAGHVMISQRMNAGHRRTADSNTGSSIQCLYYSAISAKNIAVSSVTR